MYYIKLSNGDDIVANISKNTKGDFTTLINPFKMDTRPMVTEEGVIDTLSLSSWLHPYSEDTSVRVAKSSIVTIVPATPGLKTFYKKQYDVFTRNRDKVATKEWKVKERRKPAPIQTQHEEFDDYMDEMDDAE